MFLPLFDSVEKQETGNRGEKERYDMKTKIPCQESNQYCGCVVFTLTIMLPGCAV